MPSTEQREIARTRVQNERERQETRRVSARSQRRRPLVARSSFHADRRFDFAAAADERAAAHGESTFELHDQTLGQSLLPTAAARLNTTGARP